MEHIGTSCLCSLNGTYSIYVIQVELVLVRFSDGSRLNNGTRLLLPVGERRLME